MKWISVNDENQVPPFREQLLVAITEHQFAFGWIRKIEIDANGRSFVWDTTFHKDFQDFKVKWWSRIDAPNNNI